MEDRIMKLEDVKLKIDNYFDTISAEELYKKLTEDYGMKGYKLDDPESEQLSHVPLSAEIA